MTFGHNGRRGKPQQWRIMGIIMNIRKSLICLVALLSFVTCHGAFACMPLPGYSSDPEYLRKQADVVFFGRVKTVAVDDVTSRVTVTFQVTRVWKGSRKSVRAVKTFLDQGACGLGSDFFKKGRRYLVYAQISRQGLITSTLSGTKTSDDAQSDLKELGRGRRVP